MKKKRVRYFLVKLVDEVSTMALKDRQEYDNVRVANLQTLAAYNRSRVAAGRLAVGLGNVIGDGYEALVLFEGNRLSVREQLRAEKMCEDEMG